MRRSLDDRPGALAAPLARVGRCSPLAARLGALAAALALTGACGSDGGLTRVEMSLDPETCGAATPAAIELRCAATAGIWLRSDEKGKNLDQTCRALGDGDSPRSLAELSSLLADVDLTTTSADPVRLEVAVYGSWTPADGCVAPDAFEPGAGPDVLVRGASAAVSLADGPATLPIVLRCETLSQPSDVEACEAPCRQDQDLCVASEHIARCEAERDSCDDGCVDPDCLDACEADLGSCLARSADGRCELDYQRCADTCGVDGCEEDCEDVFVDCIEEMCDATEDACLDACADGSCAVVVPS